MAQKTDKLPPDTRRTDGKPSGWWVEAYFEEYENLAIQGDAARYAGIATTTVIDHRKRHPEFKQREREAKERVLDKVRKELLKRSIDGWLEPIYHDGKLIGSKRIYDNKLLMFVAERLMREEYHLANRVEVDNQTTVRFDFRLGEREDVAEIEGEVVEELDEGFAELPPGEGG